MPKLVFSNTLGNVYLYILDRFIMFKKAYFILLLAGIFAACNNAPDDDHGHSHEGEDAHDHAAEEPVVEEDDHGHDHGDIKTIITIYSNEFEVFAEADPFTKNKESVILAHFTWLSNFKALESGKITASLTVNGKETSQTLTQPTKKGIYSFALKPQAAGYGKLVFTIINGETEYLAEINLTIHSDAHRAFEAAEAAAPSSVNVTAFTKELSWKVNFATAFPVKEAFGQVIKTTALVMPAQGDELLVTAKTNGVVRFSANTVLEGSTVKKGQTLFSISGKGLADNNSEVRFTEAKNNFAKAKADYERAQSLATDKIVSEKELLAAKTDYQNTKTLFESLSQNFSESGQKVASSLGGFVKQLFVQNGEYVAAGQPILSVSQNKNLQLKAEVSPSYASALSAINKANIHNMHSNKTYTLAELNGKILAYGRTTNTDNYLLPIQLQIANLHDFVPGSFVEVYLKTVSNAHAITVPNAAIVEEQGSYSVYVQLTPEIFEKRAIAIGVTDGLRTEVVSGLSVKERVVTKGGIYVKLAQATGGLDAHSGHVH